MMTMPVCLYVVLLKIFLMYLLPLYSYTEIINKLEIFWYCGSFLDCQLQPFGVSYSILAWGYTLDYYTADPSIVWHLRNILLVR